MKPIQAYDKLRGGYYTPHEISRFISTWAIRSENDTVLEPSCGDGSFLKAIQSTLTAFGTTSEQLIKNVTGVELDCVEAKKAAAYGSEVICSDFFSYYQENIDGKKRYDVILGNPPFIRYQNFNEDYRKIAFSLMNDHGFHPNRLTNIWLPFLLLSCKALKPDGRIGMVIPAELFQVDYAAEARQFLSEYFEKLTIVTFKRLVFDSIQQEVVLLLGERHSDQKGIRVVELDGLDDILTQGQDCLNHSETKKLDHSKDKWVKYYLSNEELELLARLNNDPRISNSTDLFETNVGVVSGENSFFVVNQATVKEYQLEDSVLPVISRADQLKGIRLTKADYSDLIEAGKKVFFFAPGNVPYENLSEPQRKYIDWGQEQGYDTNYKCRIRPRWYYVSPSWYADAFLIRQANLYPRMILNDEGALVTDTLHKVRFMMGVNGKQVAAAFLNTYTFALSDTRGRSYGGGVLTFEPGEMRKMRIPMLMAEKLDLDLIDAWQRSGKIDSILEYTDEILLREGLGLSSHEVSLLHSIWDKMRGRRISRKAS